MRFLQNAGLSDFTVLDESDPPADRSVTTRGWREKSWVVGAAVVGVIALLFTAGMAARLSAGPEPPARPQQGRSVPVTAPAPKCITREVF